MSRDILSNLIITRVVSVSTLYNDEGISRSRQNRSLWAIVVKHEGETQYFCNGKKYLSNISNVTILPKGCSYSWTCVRSGHYSVIEFDSPSSYDGIFSFHTSHGEKIYHAIQKAEKDKILNKEFAALECIKDTYSIILSLLQSEPQKYTPSAKHEKIAPALDYIASHYNKKIRNDTLAKLCGISTVYFRKLFTEATDKTPTEYVQWVKIEKSKEMLKSDHGTIGNIATELGYQNIYDFSRSFKKQVGVSPKSFREKENNKS